jgi:hypothetical protein
MPCIHGYFFHNWEKWETYKNEYVLKSLLKQDPDLAKQFAQVEPRQKRQCLRCGKEQDRKIWLQE